jgi:hypothetical protein
MTEASQLSVRKLTPTASPNKAQGRRASGAPWETIAPIKSTLKAERVAEFSQVTKWLEYPQTPK